MNAKNTYEDLKKIIRNVKIANVKLTKKLEAAKLNSKAYEPERIEEYRLRILHKKPDYVYSFTGAVIFTRWYRANGLTRSQAEVIVILSYYKYFLMADFKYWHRGINKIFKTLLNGLIEMGYVLRVELPGKSRLRKRYSFVLTKKGKDLSADYEKYFDEKIVEFKEAKYGKGFVFDEDDYFRRVRIPRKERREAQGGGRLPRLIPTRDRFRDNDKKDEQAGE